MPYKIGVLGASGRMGKTLVQALAQTTAVLGAAVEHAGSSSIGAVAGVLAGLGANGVLIAPSLADVISHCDVVIDFTAPAATLEHLQICAEHNVPIVIGTTGLTDSQNTQVSSTAATLPVVYAANYSVGVNVSLKLLEVAAKIMGDSVDIEIIEAHHRHKVDAPSGTALMMGRAITDAMAVKLNDVAVYARQGHTGARTDKEIGFQTIRGGDIVGEHTVMFIGEGERIEVKHLATSRMNFATGAVRAALWLAANKKPGLYTMVDVLGLDQY